MTHSPHQKPEAWIDILRAKWWAHKLSKSIFVLIQRDREDNGS